MDKNTLIKNKAVVKVAAAVAALTLIAAASLLPAKSEPAQLSDPNVLNPAPVVMTLEEPDDAVIEEEETEEEKKQKIGFFTRLKLAFYAFCAGAGAWIAHKIPWGKIFNRRNAIIVLILAVVGILAWYVGLPALSEYVKGAV